MKRVAFQTRAVVGITLTVIAGAGGAGAFLPLVGRLAFAQEYAASETGAIAAVVGKTSIFEADVQREISRVTKGTTKPRSEDLAGIRQAMLEQLIKQELIMIRFAKDRRVVPEKQIDAEIAKRRKSLADRGIDWEKHLRDERLDEAALRRSLRWQLSWKTYLEHMTNEENLQRYFEKHKAAFDGTELRVSHILLAIPQDAGPEAWNDAIKRAAEIREEIVSDRTTFSLAAEKYSQAPTAEQGGDIGWIRRHDPMPESFSKAAFELKLDEISAPVVTLSGVHLIRFRDVKPGTKKLPEVRAEVERAVTRYLFDWLADGERAQVKVEIR